MRAHGLRWLALREFAPAIPRLDVERARHPEGLGEDEFVKDNTVRTVMRMADPDDPNGPGLIVKRYKFRDLLGRLRHVVVPTKPAVEWRVCRALQAAGIPTCDVLAVAVRRRFGMPQEGLLVSREIQGVTSPMEFLNAVRDGAASCDAAYRAELARELAELTAALVNGGFYHRDYHAGNLLLRPDAPPGQRLFVIDLHAIRRRRPRGRRLLRMLAMVGNLARHPAVPHGDAVLFLRRFLELWEGGPGAGDEAVGQWAAAIKKKRMRLHRRHMKSRTRRCLVRSSLFVPEGTLRRAVRRRRDFPQEEALGVVERHLAALAGRDEGPRVLRHTSRTAVSVCPCPAVPPFGVSQPVPAEEVRPGEVCVKTFYRHGLVARLKDMMRLRSRARDGWIGARGCSVRGVPAARPLALIESRFRLLGGPDHLITEALDADASLDELAHGDLPPPGARRRLGRALARLFDLMEREEVYHPDTKPGNILVKETDGEFRLWMVDLERMEFGVRWPLRYWVKTLAKVNAGLGSEVTLLDRMRCLRELSRGRWDARQRLEVARAVLNVSLQRRVAWLRRPRAG